MEISQEFLSASRPLKFQDFFTQKEALKQFWYTMYFYWEKEARPLSCASQFHVSAKKFPVSVVFLLLVW